MILTDWYSPAFKAGGPITSIYSTCYLLKDHFNFYILTSNTDLDGSRIDVKADTWIMGENGENIYYSSEGLSSSLLKAALKKSQSKDIWLNSMFSIQFTIKPLFYLKGTPNLRVFLSPRGMLHPQAFGQKGLKKRVALYLMYYLGMLKKVEFIASNELEKRYISIKLPTKKVHILPNIPNVNFWQESIEAAPDPSLTVVSRIAPEKNSLFALEILKSLFTPCDVHWIGESKNKQYQGLFDEKLHELPSHINLTLHGSQNKVFIKEKLLKSKVFFLPTLGENFGQAIFEALAIGVPVVIGKPTAFNKAEEAGAGFVNNPEDIQSNVIALETILKENEEAWLTRSKNAKEFSKQIIQPSELINQYKLIWFNK